MIYNFGVDHSRLDVIEKKQLELFSDAYWKENAGRTIASESEGFEEMIDAFNEDREYNTHGIQLELKFKRYGSTPYYVEKIGNRVFRKEETNKKDKKPRKTHREMLVDLILKQRELFAKKIKAAMGEDNKIYSPLTWMEALNN